MPTKSTQKLHLELEAAIEKYPTLSVYEMVGVLELVKLEAVMSMMEPTTPEDLLDEDDDKEGEEWKDGE